MSWEPKDHLGMTEEQWKIFQEATHGYGEQDANGVDISLLRENLRLTPAQRLEKLQRAHTCFVEVDNARNHRVSKNNRHA
jgi:hypothetical protein